MLDYGIIGNCKTCALVKKDTSIDWFCYPDFNSSSAFAKIIDNDNGGNFKIIPKGKFKITQSYIKNTNILETNFKSKNAEFKVIDFFPRYRKILPKKNPLFRQNRLIRIIKLIKGKVKFKVIYNPKLDYAIGGDIYSIEDDLLISKNKDLKISLFSNVDYQKILSNEYIDLDHTKYFVVGEKPDPQHYNVKKCLNLLSMTKRYWDDWVKTLILPEKNRNLIIRSALTLKILTFSQTGAIIAAATTSIPEEIGSSRNWDYRFCWVRDASFTVDALKKIGRDYEAKKLIEFIFNNSLNKKKHLQIMYGIHGESELTEIELLHLKGYKGSMPVRIGNGAFDQKQNDIYGSLIDIIYLYYIYYKYENKIPQKFWKFLKYLVKMIEKNWDTTDKGIWEFREKEVHFTYSKLMCYVGIDRAMKIANHFGKIDLFFKWEHLREKIKEDIIKNAWKKDAFSMHYETSALDASVLLMTYHEFLDKNDPRIKSTVKKIRKELSKGVFVQRYKIKDDNGYTNSSFTICSFWLIDALYYIGEEKLARKLFNQIIKYSNHLGLFAEDHNIKSKKIIGNFPQAYTHIALINSAILLSEWSSKRIEHVRRKNKII